MNRHTLGIVGVLLTGVFFIPFAAQAQTISVDFGSGTCSLSGASPLNFPNPYTCGNITITPKGTGSARVEAIDGNADVLRFLNATITANDVIQDFHIVASREFVPGPSTSGGNVYYRTTANGAFSTTNANNVITVRSTVTDVATITTEEMFLGQGSDSDGDGSTIALAPAQNTQWITPPSLTGNRILKMDFWFSLGAAAQKINLDSITIQNKSTSGGEGPSSGRGRTYGWQDADGR